MPSPYLLRQQLDVSDAVRCVCVHPNGSIVSGCTKGHITVFSSESNSYSQSFRFKAHEGTVYYVYGSFTNGDKTTPTIYSCGADKKCVLSSFGGEQLKVFEGHAGNVVQVTEDAENGLLFTADWSGAVYVWRIETACCVWKYEEHSYAVCFTKLPDGRLATASQNKSIHVLQASPNNVCEWSCVKEVTNAHNEGIRALSVSPSFGVLSVSNDTNIKLWKLSTFECIQSSSKHDAFIFDVKVCPDDDSFALTCSEDFTCIVWKLPNLEATQEITHGATVWQASFCKGGDFVTACADASVRVWTTNETLALPETDRKAYAEASLKQKTKVSSPVDASAYPPVSTLSTTRGTRLGQTKVFNENDTPIAYQWSGLQWERIGEVVGKKETRTYQGDQYFPAGEYDYVIDVQIGDSSANKPLPYRNGQDPAIVAEQFCARENIPKSSINDIVEFIKKNTGGEATPAYTPTQATSTESKKFSSSIFPIEECLLVEAKKINVIIEKLKDIQNNLTDPSLHLTDIEKQHLASALTLISGDAWGSAKFKESELKVIFDKLALWPTEDQAPVMDLWRIIALHRQAADIAKHDEGWPYISHALHLVKENGNAARLSLIFLGNLFATPTFSQILTRKQSWVLGGLQQQYDTHKFGREIGTVLYNLEVAMKTSHGAASAEKRFELLRASISLIDQQQKIVSPPQTHLEAMYRTLCVIGDILYETKNTDSQISAEIKNKIILLEGLAATAKEKRFRDMLDEIKRMLT